MKKCAPTYNNSVEGFLIGKKKVFNWCLIVLYTITLITLIFSFRKVPLNANHNDVSDTPHDDVKTAYYSNYFLP